MSHRMSSIAAGAVRGAAVATLCLATLACTTGLAPLDPDGVVGTWTWLRSTGGIAGTTRTPETEGFTGVLRFDADGTVEWRVDGERVWQTTWSLGRAREGSPLAGEEVVFYGEPVVGWPYQAVHVEGAGLILTDPCCDGFVHEYEARGP